LGRRNEKVDVDDDAALGRNSSKIESCRMFAGAVNVRALPESVALASSVSDVAQARRARI
jgi:hypothetical protein